MALLGLTDPYWSLSVLTGPYWALLSLTGPHLAVLVPFLNLHTNKLTNELITNGHYDYDLLVCFRTKKNSLFHLFIEKIYHSMNKITFFLKTR